LRSNISLDLANLLQVGFDLRYTLERKILWPKIKASDRRQYISMVEHLTFINPLAKYETNSLLRLCRINLRSESFVIKNEFLA
jgi:hypothetical protein